MSEGPELPGPPETPPQPNPTPPPDPDQPGGPVQGVFTVRCESCLALAYVDDTAPAADPDAALRALADTNCPRGGKLACPNSSETRRDRDERDPARTRLRVGTVTALTATRAVVAVDGDTVSAVRTAGAALAVGNTVAVQPAGNQWVLIGRTL